MTAKERALRELKIRAAMSELVLDHRFGEFINVIREMREVAIEDICNERVMMSERLTLGAIGELRAYKTIISNYEEFADRTVQNIASETDPA